MKNCTRCSNEVKINYNGYGYCFECFHIVYTLPLLENMTQEEKERAAKINNNFKKWLMNKGPC